MLRRTRRRFWVILFPGLSSGAAEREIWFFFILCWACVWEGKEFWFSFTRFWLLCHGPKSIFFSSPSWLLSTPFHLINKTMVLFLGPLKFCLGAYPAYCLHPLPLFIYFLFIYFSFFFFSNHIFHQFMILFSLPFFS